MNSTPTLPPFPAASRPFNTPSSAFALDRMQTRFAIRVASRLTASAESVSPDIAERLRFARGQALLRARSSRTEAVGAPVALGRGGTLSLGGRAPGGWWRVAALIPALALMGGLLLIQHMEDDAQISVAAEIDAALLSDDLPPTAYGDAGFAEYLKSPGE